MSPVSPKGWTIAEMDAIAENLREELHKLKFVNSLIKLVGQEQRCHLFDSILLRWLEMRVQPRKCVSLDMIDSCVEETIDLVAKILRSGM